VLQLINAKDENTGGHCKRVPELTMMIADACHRSQSEVLKDFKMTDNDRYELTTSRLVA